MNAYAREIGRYPLLSGEEEAELATRHAQTRDPRLARRLIEANLRLVMSVARSFVGSRHAADLIQEGNLGLIEAVKRFDPSRGVKLATYATEWIRGYILQYLVKNHRIVHLGSRAERRLFFGMRHKESDEAAAEVAAALGLDEQDVAKLCGRIAPEVEVSKAVIETTEHYGDPILRRKLVRFGKGLAGREREIFRRRLFARNPANVSEIAKRNRVSRARIKRIEYDLLRRIRKELHITRESALG